MVSEAKTTKDQQRIIDYVAALGGKSNLTSVDACTTRLRLIVADKDKVNDQELKRLGARGVLRPGGQMQFKSSSAQKQTVWPQKSENTTCSLQ